MSWTLPDLIDLEFFLHQDEGEDLDRLAARDREICASLPPAVSSAEAADAVLIQTWLHWRRKADAAEHAAALPGAVWQELFCLFLAAALLAGLSSGAGLAFSLLSYAGKEPVNVASYFAVFVVLQAALFFLLTVSFLCSRVRGSSLFASSLLYRLTRQLFAWLLRKFLTVAARKTRGQVSAKTRLQWAAHAGSIRQLRQQYGLLFLRPFFFLGQLFGVSFNVGALVATLLKVVGADLAFGWQTTLQIKADAIHAFVRWISLPWVWLMPAAVPSPAQIEGSRLFLKDGIYHLSSQNLASWWPFLCLAVLCYGLLPRLALLAAALCGQYRDLARLTFAQSRCRQLVRRMRIPALSTAACAEARRPLKSLPPDPQAAETALVQPVVPAAAADDMPPIAALLPDELLAVCPQPVLQEQIRCRCGYRLCRIVPFWTMDRSEDEELAALQSAMREHSCRDLLLIHEAWQPPVQELLAWLGLLRRSLGPQPAILLALVGKPSAGTVLTPVRREHLQIWRQKLAAISDPGLQLLELVKP